MTAWRIVDDHPLYEVSDGGDIRNRKTGHVLKHMIDRRGYHRVHLNQKHAVVHRIVAKAFLPGEPFPLVRHLDDNRDHNHVGNLAWGTQHDNVLDAVRNGVHQQTRKTHCPRNHEYTEENTYRRPGNPARNCVECRRDTRLRR